MIECPMCDGDDEFLRQQCPFCDGSGVLFLEEEDECN